MKSLMKVSFCLLAALILAGCGKAARVEKDLDPAATINEAAQSIAKNDPGALWVMMPKSYRSDINDIAHMLGEKMPESVWDKAFSLVGKLGNILTTKKSMIVEMSGKDLPPGVSKADAEYAIESK